MSEEHKFSEGIEAQIASIVIDDEYETSKRNNSVKNSDFESFVDMYNVDRTEKNYDWESDIMLPEFASHMLAQSAIDADQGFSTRDFVDVYLEDERPEAKIQAEAVKELTNRTLNQRHLNHYQKYIRAKLINHLNGHVYIEAFWERKSVNSMVSQEVITGEFIEEEIEKVVIDRFNYDVYDPRNVFTDNNYVYTLQDKSYVIFRREKTLQELKADAIAEGYFNLDLLEGVSPPTETETSRESYNDTDNHSKSINKTNKPYDILKRYGGFWCKITERDEEGNPVEAEPGIDIEGNPIEDAEWHECIITYALSGGTRILIGFYLTPYVDAEGNPYRPITRGLCYIHPTNDAGLGDGKGSREIQVAIDDTFNVSSDRVRMATTPAFIGRRDALQDTSSFHVSPGNLIEADNPNDIRELLIQDNIAGALNQIALLTGKMQQYSSITPPSLGQTGAASNTATAIAKASSSTDVRNNYKTMTFEHTALTDLYWFISHMTFVFARPETGLKLMGEKVINFNPAKDYYYKPVTSTIETEHTKGLKIQRWTQLMSTIANIQHPDAIKVINKSLLEIYKLMGDEYFNVVNSVLNPAIPIQQQGGGGEQEQGGQAIDMQGQPSNQFGIEQSEEEQGVRSEFIV